MKLKTIIDKIKQETGLDEQSILELIDKKQKELDNLITKEGAAILVAKEFGIKLEFSNQQRLQIRNLVPGLKNVSVVGRVFKITEPIEFEKNGNKGKLAKLYVGDETGYFILTLWNDQVSYVEDKLIKLGDVIEVKGALVKENMYGEIEISLGKYGLIKKSDASLPSLEELEKLHFQSYRKASIAELKPGYYEVSGMIVHIFKSNYVFEFCPICKSRIEAHYCKQHGNVEPNYSIILNTLLDDETQTIRVVFFNETASKLLGMDAREFLGVEDKEGLLREKILGKEVIVKGKVRKNPIFNRLELLADSVEYLNIDKATNELASVLL